MVLQSRGIYLWYTDSQYNPTIISAEERLKYDILAYPDHRFRAPIYIIAKSHKVLELVAIDKFSKPLIDLTLGFSYKDIEEYVGQRQEYLIKNQDKQARKLSLELKGFSSINWKEYISNRSLYNPNSVIKTYNVTDTIFRNRFNKIIENLIFNNLINYDQYLFLKQKSRNNKYLVRADVLSNRLITESPYFDAIQLAVDFAYNKAQSDSSESNYIEDNISIDANGNITYSGFTLREILELNTFNYRFSAHINKLTLSQVKWIAISKEWEDLRRFISDSLGNIFNYSKKENKISFLPESDLSHVKRLFIDFIVKPFPILKKLEFYLWEHDVILDRRRMFKELSSKFYNRLVDCSKNTSNELKLQNEFLRDNKIGHTYE